MAKILQDSTSKQFSMKLPKELCRFLGITRGQEYEIHPLPEGSRRNGFMVILKK